MLDETGLACRSTTREGTHTFLSSGDVDWFRALGRRLLGPELTEALPVSFPDP